MVGVAGSKVIADRQRRHLVASRSPTRASVCTFPDSAASRAEKQMLRVTRIDRDSPDASNHIDAIRPVSLPIRNHRRSDRLPARRQRNCSWRSNGSSRCLLGQCRRGFCNCGGEWLRRRRRGLFCFARLACTLCLALLEARLRCSCCRNVGEDLVVKSGIALSEIGEEALERLTAVDFLCLLAARCASCLCVGLASHAGVPPLRVFRYPSRPRPRLEKFCPAQYPSPLETCAAARLHGHQEDRD